jgi:hypothetical protein
MRCPEFLTRIRSGLAPRLKPVILQVPSSLTENPTDGVDKLFDADPAITVASLEGTSSLLAFLCTLSNQLRYVCVVLHLRPGFHPRPVQAQVRCLA